MTSTETTKIVNIKQGDMSAIGGVEKVNASIKQTQNEANKAAQVTTKLNDALVELNRQNKIESIAKSAARYAAETGNARTAQLQLNSALQKAGATHVEIQKAVRAYSAEIKKVANETENAADAARRYDQAFTKASFKSAAFGDLDTGVGSIRGLLDTLSPGAGSGLTVVQDLFAARESVERLGPGVKFLGESAASSSGLVGSLATGVSSLIPGLSAAGAGFAAISIVALPVVAALGALAVGFQELERGKAIAEAAFNALEAQRRAEEGITELTSEEATKRLAEAEENAARQRQIISENNTIIEQSYRDAQSAIPVIGDAATRLFDATGGFNSVKESTEAAQKELTQATADIEVLRAALDDSSFAANDLAIQIEKDVEVAKKRLAEEAKLTAEYEKSIATIAQLKQQQDDLNKSYREASAAVLARRQLEDRRAQEDRDKTARRAQEDLDRALESAAKAHEANLIAIQQRGNDAILAARADLAKKEAETVTRIADLQAQFREDQAKAEAEYFKQRKRDTEDYHRDRRRAEADFARSQLEGLINNDITSLVLDQGAFDVEQRRARQDRRRDRRRGREDFEGDRAEAEAALAQKIADIQAELVEYQNATAAKILAIQTQTANDLLLAQAAYDERLRLDAEERQIKSDREAEDLRITLERRTQDRQAEDMARLVSHHAALAQIQEKAMLEQSIADGLKFKLLEVQALLASTSAGVMNLANGLPITGGGGYTGAGGSQINNPKTNAPIAPSNMTPFSPQFTGGQNTRGRGGDGGGNMSVQITPQVVEIGGMQFVPYSVFEESINAVVAGIHRARNQRAG